MILAESMWSILIHIIKTIERSQKTKRGLPTYASLFDLRLDLDLTLSLLISYLIPFLHALSLDLSLDLDLPRCYWSPVRFALSVLISYSIPSPHYQRGIQLFFVVLIHHICKIYCSFVWIQNDNFRTFFVKRKNKRFRKVEVVVPSAELSVDMSTRKKKRQPPVDRLGNIKI